MQTRHLPGTDLDLSVVGFGCWAMGGLWWGDDVRDVIIATKVGVRWDGEGMHARSDLTAPHIRSDVEASLRRLGLERIDLLQIHWPCQLDTPLEETIEALEQLRREGKVRYFGLCNYPADDLNRAASLGHVDSLQTPYSMLRREYEAELLGACAQLPAGPGEKETRQLGVLAYEPLCRGLLTGKFNATARFPESDLRGRDDRFQGPRFLKALTIVSRLQLLGKRLGTPVGPLALAWVLRQPGLTSAIVGAKRPAQVEENVTAAALLDRELPWDEIDRIVGSYRG